MAKRRARRTTRAASRPSPRPKKPAPRGTVAPPKNDARRRSPETLRLRSLEPSFTVGDIERSVRFYTDVLGFIVGERWTDGEALRGVRLKAGVCELNLSQDDWAKGHDRKRGEAVRIWCKTAQDIDALAERIKAAGGRLIEEPKDQPWGVRVLAVDDPDGFHLSIYQERGK